MYRAANQIFRRHPGRAHAALAASIGGAVLVGFETRRRHHNVLLADSGTTSVAWDGKQVSTVPSSARFHARGSETAQTPAPPSQTRRHSAAELNKDTKAGDLNTASSTDRVAAVFDGFRGFSLLGLGDRITDLLIPSWAKVLPGLIKKLQNELSMAPWSLSWEIWEEAHDPEINPEIVWDARVRISDDLCVEEKQFLAKRKPQVAKALARYLDVPESEVHPEDVPVVAMCGSGGGLRALVAGTSSFYSAQQAGLFDCTTYTAGVSGSCWLQTLYYSSIGQTSHARMLDHFKQRLDVHIAFPPAALSLLSQAPTNKFLLSGPVEKLKGVPDAEFGLVDVYGLLLAARLLVPKGELRVSDYDLKLSNQRYFVDFGDQPLPIYTAVRHEIPEIEVSGREAAIEKKKLPGKESWFQWFEWTPYEFYCEELSAGIPTWAVGRKFMDGKNQWRQNGLALPEIKIPLIMGIWGSAFCATLSHYYKEIAPIWKGTGLGDSLDSLLAEQQEDMGKYHAFDPASIPNYTLGLRDKLPRSCPESIHKAEHFRLMDAGMSNNLPFYPLLRPGRDIDVIIAFDVSADAPLDNWIKVAEGYAKQRKIKGWPMGAGWPPRTNQKEQTVEELEAAQASTTKEVEQRQQIARKQEDDLGPCNVWVGTKAERENDQEPPPSTRLVSDDDEHHLSSPDAGFAVIYFPLIPNEKVPGVDPAKSDFMSTWNFVYTPEEIDSVVALAKANFEAGEEQTRRTIRAVWERKRQLRLEQEKEAKEMRRRMRMRRGEALGKKGEGDHFS